MTTVWQHSESFADTNLQMLDDGYLCDVIFAAGNDKIRLECHKFILASRSPVFHAMFCGTLAESNDVINIPDIEEPILRIVVRYLYGCKVDLTADIVMPLLYAAEKYDVSSLVTMCELYLKEIIDPDNVCTILDQAIRFECLDLKQQCLDFIEHNSKCVLASDAFVEMSVEGLKEILEVNIMTSSECELYLACKRWASKRIESTDKQATGEEIRNKLGNELMNLIQFERMSLEEFTDVVSNDNILTKEEYVCFHEEIATRKKVSKFKKEPRRMTNKKYMFKRTLGIGDTPCILDGRQEGFTFTVSKECTMTAVDMFLPFTEGSAEGVLEIWEGWRLILSQNVKLCYTSGLIHKLVNLDTPIRLKSRHEYSIRHKMKGARAYRCTRGLAEISKHNVTMTLLNLKVGASYSGTSVNCGQFYGFELLINAFYEHARPIYKK